MRPGVRASPSSRVTSENPSNFSEGYRLRSTLSRVAWCRRRLAPWLAAGAGLLTPSPRGQDSVQVTISTEGISAFGMQKAVAQFSVI